MGLPSGTFGSTYAGSLRVSVSAIFGGSAFSSNYNSWGTSASNVVLRAAVTTPGGTIYLPIISRIGPSAEVVLDYPGGGETWSLSMEELAYSIAGAGDAWAEQIRLVAELTKR